MLSIIIPVFNGEKTLGALMDSIERSDFKEYEVIVVNDCSADQTDSVINSYAIRHISLPKRLGPGIARNSGAQEARGKILVFFDADIEIFPDTLGKIACKFGDNPQVKVLVGIYDEKPVNKGFFPKFKALWFSSLFDKNASQTDSLEGFCTAIDSDVFRQSGGFSPVYANSSTEDYELGCRLRQKYIIYFDSNIKVKHVFPGFFKNAARFFRRTCDFVPLYIRQDKACRGRTLSRDGLVSLCSLASFLLLPFVFLGNQIAGVIFWLFIFGFLFFGSRFLRLVLQKGEVLFTIASIIVYYINSVILGLAMVAGAFRYSILLK
jgi:glycosyltransferase involved in cell wall biosynthesis